MSSPIPSPAPGQCSSRIGPKGVANVTVVAVLAAIYIPIVVLRLYTRQVILKALWWDDYTIVLAMVFLLPYNGLAWYSTYLRMGEHLLCVDPLNVPRILLFKFVNQVLVIFSNMFPRISVTLFLIRLFAISRRVQGMLYSFTFFFSAVWIACAICMFPQCSPREKLWNPLIPGQCWPETTSLAPSYLNGAVAILTDFVLALLPILFLWNVQMQRRLKIGIRLVMGLGAFTGVCALTRTIMLHKAQDPDVTYALVDLGIFATLEAAVAIIAATIPTLRPLFTQRGARSSSDPHTSRQKLQPGYKSLGTKNTFSANSNVLKPSTSGDRPHDGTNRVPNGPYQANSQASGGFDIQRSQQDMIPLVNKNGIGKRVDVEVFWSCGKGKWENRID